MNRVVEMPVRSSSAISTFHTEKICKLSRGSCVDRVCSCSGASFIYGQLVDRAEGESWRPWMDSWDKPCEPPPTPTPLLFVKSVGKLTKKHDACFCLVCRFLLCFVALIIFFVLYLIPPHVNSRNTL